jgi:hypothetical protein
MHRISRSLCVGLIFTAFFSGGSVRAQQTAPPPSNTSNQEMRDALRETQAQVNELQHRLDAQEAATTRPAPTTVKSAGHGSDINLPPNLRAGYSLDDGFYIRSDDGSFLLHPWIYMQARYSYNYRSQASATQGHDSESGFELPRVKFILDGNIITRDLTYQFIWNSTDTTGFLTLQDAWGRYHLPGTNLAIEGGQIRNPLDHEQILFATKSMTPDRSITNNVLLNGDDIVKGVKLAAGYDLPSPVRGEIAFSSGERNFDTDFQPYPTNPANWGVAGRVEWKLMGDWHDYTQFSSLDNKHPLLVLGAGCDYTEAGQAGGTTGVLDAQYNLPNGLGLYGAYLGRYVRDNAGTPANDGGIVPGGSLITHNTFDQTFRAQVSYLIGRRFEPFVHYEFLSFDPNQFAPGTNVNINDIMAGFNYYFYGQRAKFTFGTSYLPQGSPVTSTIMDLLTSHNGQEIIVQAQVQLIF